ncbi:SpvB/TcaC N-terminal domain-containing protein [Teredinibacter sp. KSP-S5-2]|uniref:SpvB/TcaC N-terminal domain-containing protein n=1 Tax=Teredinibacter sp. KSP-S5-2 TaxID=3034506 RepID=UPI0029345E98|nr:SpvB/TcaC N-terminal domain-containing protein [Teredinibacter sp. KSP-S5-2]WNO11239.1 SpvB/TcaC N-terminal domain-containing protein [Teredinibacter sp. KSP-S5-2]
MFASAVQALSVSTTTSSTGTYTLSWSKSSGYTYWLYEKYGSGAWNSGGNVTPMTSYTYTGKTNGVWYYKLKSTYCITYPVNQCYTNWSNEVSVTVALLGTVGSISLPSTDTDGAFSVSWGAVSGATKYYVQRRTSSSSWPSTYLQSNSSTSYSESGLTNGTYYYRVQACNAGGCSSWRDSSSIDVIRTPGQPANITVVSSSTTGEFTVTWGTASGSYSSYVLERQVNGGSWSQIHSGSTSTRAKAQNVGDGTYRYRVKACNSLSCSAPTYSNNVVVKLPPGAPGFNALSSNDADGYYTVSWALGSGIVESIELQRRLNGGSWSAELCSGTTNCPNGVSFSEINLADGSYSYQLRACNSSGCSAWVTSSTVVVMRPSGMPASLSVPSADADGAFTVSWVAGTGTAETYQLQRKSGSSGSWSGNLISGNPISYSQTGLANGTYYYQVQACNRNGCSGWRASSAVTVTHIPGLPASISVPASDDDGAFNINWGAGSGIIDSYRLYRQYNGGSWELAYTGSARSYDETSLADGNYAYRAQACNVSGCSSYRTSGLVAVDHPMTSVSMTLAGSSYTGSYQLSWQASPEYKYKLYEKLGNGTYQQIANYDYIPSPQTLTKSFSNKANGIWAYKVELEYCRDYPVSMCYVGGTGTASIEVHVRPTPVAPAQITVPSYTDGSYVVSWLASDASTEPQKYYLERSSNGGSSWSNIPLNNDGLDLSYNEPSRPEGNYLYRVRAWNTTDYSAWRTSSNVSVKELPGNPTSLVAPAEHGDGAVPVSWSGASGLVDSYQVSTQSGGSWGAGVTVTGTSYTPNPALADGTYAFRVRACNTTGCNSSWLQQTGTTAVKRKPGAVSSITVPTTTSTNGQINLTWSAASGTVESYELRRYRVGQTEGALVATMGANTAITDEVGSGTYTYQIRSCNSVHCADTWATSAEVSVVLPSPNYAETYTGNVADVSLINSAPALPANYIGATAGQAGVSGGTATYSVPVAIPPGRNGVQPNVSLSYSAKGGNGLLGVGWSLSAGSAIARCGATYAQDGFTHSVQYDLGKDRLCLNGSRLVAVSGGYGYMGAVYRTEVDQFVRVTQHGGSLDDSTTWFSAEYKDGSVAYFGRTSQSQVVHQGVSTPISWLISFQHDAVGNTSGEAHTGSIPTNANNFIHYQYQTFGAGEVLLSAIQYTGEGEFLPGDRQVIFNYTALPNTQKRVHYLAGGQSETTQKLASIDTQVGLDKVQHYALRYQDSAASQRPLIRGIQQCGWEAGALACLPETTFNWLDNRHIAPPETLKVGGQTPYTDVLRVDAALPYGDFNGDGTRDFPGHYVDAEQRSRGANTVAAADSCMYGAATSKFQCIDVDVDRDGTSDPHKIQDFYWYVDYSSDGLGNYVNTGIRMETYVRQFDAQGNLVADQETRRVAIGRHDNFLGTSDVNGDGYPDIMLHKVERNTFNASPKGTVYLQVILHNRSATAPFYDNNARQTLYTHASTSNVIGGLTPNPDWPVNPTESTSPVGDIDGNGLMDFVVSMTAGPYDGVLKSFPEPLPKRFLMNFSTPNGLNFVDQGQAYGGAASAGQMVTTLMGETMPASSISVLFFHRFIDVNGDGLPDILQWSQGTKLVLRLNQGGSFGPEQVLSENPYFPIRYASQYVGPGVLYNMVTAKYGEAMQVADINGDGRPELLYPGERLIEGCSQVFDHHIKINQSGWVNLCGDELYGAYSTTDSNEYPQSPISVYHNDDSIYRYKALYFDPQADGTYSLREENTDLIGSASEVAMIDAFGDGNLDMVFAYGPRAALSDNSMGTMTAEGSALFGNNYGIYITRNYGAGTGTNGGDYQPVDVIQGVDNPYGLTSEWDYRPLSTGDASIFAANGSSAQPMYQPANAYVDPAEGYFHFGSSMYVVKTLRQSNGLGGMNAVHYGYRGAMYNFQGRGFTGFRSIIRHTETLENGVDVSVVNHTDFHQIYPYVSAVQYQASFLASTYQGYNSYNLFGDNTGTCGLDTDTRPAKAADALSFSESCYQLNAAHQSAMTGLGVSQIVSTYAHQSGGIRNALNCSGPTSCTLGGELSRNRVEVSAIDEWGNPTTTSQTQADDWGTQVTNTVTTYASGAGQETAWWLNKATQSVVTKQAITGRNLLDDALELYSGDKTGLDNAVIITTILSYNNSRMRVATGVAISSSDAARSSQAQTQFNAYGLPEWVKTTASVLNSSNQWVAQTRQVSTSYTTDGYFPQTVSNDLGHSVSSVIDPALGVATSVTRQLDATTSLTAETDYDPFGRPLETRALGSATQYTRYTTPDANAPGLAVTQVTVTQAGSPTVKSYQDRLGRTLRTATQGFDGGWLYVDNTYTSRGKLAFESVPGTTPLTGADDLGANGVWYTGYDPVGRLTGKIKSQSCGSDGVDGLVTTQYTTVDYTTHISLTDACSGGGNDHSLSMSRTYNSQQQLVKTVDALDGITRYAYNTLGSPAVITDVENNSIVAHYDGLGRKTQVNDPNQGITDFVYNGFGEVQQETRANNKTVSYYLDTLGRVTLRRATGEADSTYLYDNVAYGYGQMYQESNGSLTRTTSFNSLGQPLTTTETLGGDSHSVTQLYDANYGRLKGLRYPNNLTLEYQYNDLGYLTQLKNAANGYAYQTINSMDQWGNITGAMLGNGVSETAQYSDVNGQVLSLGATRGTTALLSIYYQQYDGYGNIELETVQNGADAYSEYYVYDKLHRLTQSGYNDFIGASITYSYNASGNLLSKSDYARNYDYTTGTSGGPNAVKRIEKILKQANGTTSYQWESFSYDARGNMLTGDGLTQAIYNAMDKPTQINKDGALLTFDYGPSQMRYRQVKSDNGDTTTTRYIGKLYEEVTEQTSIGLKQSWRAYIGSVAVVGEEDGTPSIRYQHRDRLGSARTFTDEAGNIVARRDYDPFGKPRKPDGTLKEEHWIAGVPMEPILDDLDSAKTPRGFTDHEHLDAVQYIHMNGRVYDYNLGRFLSVDPYIQSPGNSQSINPYSYIMNNPLAGVDPTGYVSKGVEDKANEKADKGCGVNCTTYVFDGHGNASTPFSKMNEYKKSDNANSNNNNGGEQQNNADKKETPTGTTPTQDVGSQEQRDKKLADGKVNANNEGTPVEEEVVVTGVNTSIPKSALSNAQVAAVRGPSHEGQNKGDWTTKDFLKHYLFGGGKAVNLSDVGLGDDFENSESVKNATEKFMEGVLNGPIYNLKASDRVLRNVTNDGAKDFTGKPALFSLGDGWLNMSASCSSGNCTFNFSTSDMFVDALDINDQWRGNQDLPFSQPYQINHSWTVDRSY